MKATRIHRVIAAPLDGSPVEFGALHLSAPPPSLNNLFINVKRKGRVKSPDYNAWITTALLQLRRQNGWHVGGPVYIRLVFNRQDTRADLDNLIKPTVDILVAAGRIQDDRHMMKVEAEFASGTHGTRIEIRRWPMASKTAVAA